MTMRSLSTFLVAVGLALTAYAESAEPAKSAPEVRPLLIGAAVPDVSVRTAKGDTVSLKSVVTEKPTVLIFYRGGWCPFCSKQLGGLEGVDPKLRELGYQIVAVSPDKPEKLNETAAKHKLTYTLLSDSKMDASKAFGIAFKVDDATLEKYKSYKIDLSEASGEPHHLLPVPSVFILGTDGKIRFTYVNPDYKVRLDGDVLLAAAKANIAGK